MVNSPVNNTKYVCVSLDMVGNEVRSDPAYCTVIAEASEYDTSIKRSIKYD